MGTIPSLALAAFMVSTIARVEYESAWTVAKYSTARASSEVALSWSPAGPKPMTLPRNEGSANGDLLPLKSGPINSPRVKKETADSSRCFVSSWRCSQRTSAGFCPKALAFFSSAWKHGCVSITKSNAAPAALWPASWRKRSGSMAESKGPQTPDTGNALLVEVIWQAEVPAIKAIQAFSGGQLFKGAAPKQPRPPAWASMAPTPKMVEVDSPSSFAALGPSGLTTLPRPFTSLPCPILVVCRSSKPDASKKSNAQSLFSASKFHLQTTVHWLRMPAPVSPFSKSEALCIK